MSDGRSGLRTVAWIAIAVALVLATLAVVVLRRTGGVPAGALELLALGSDGRFGTDIELATSEDGADGYPFVLALTNRGRNALQPRSLSLMIPSWFRLANAEGDEIAVERSEAEPLARVRLEFESETVEPDAFPLVPAGFDQLRLDFVLGAVDCRLSWDGVPEFVPSPPWAEERLSSVVLYWAIDTDEGRETGLLRVRVPAGSLPRVPVDMEFGTPTRHRGAAPRPVLDSLSMEYSVVSTCGEPERPLELTAVAWRSATGALMIEVQHAGRPRIHLFDTDSDGRIDLEIRDTDADGVFETRRPVSYATPAFLIPRR